MKSDADVRERLREAAFKAVRTIEIAMAPIDPRADGMADYLDPKEMHRMQQAAIAALGAWAKTVEVPKDAPQDLTDAEKREATKRLLRERPAALLELAREAGVEIRALQVAIGEEAP